jgi:hypothetical protein
VIDADTNFTAHFIPPSDVPAGQLAAATKTSAALGLFRPMALHPFPLVPVVIPSPMRSDPLCLSERAQGPHVLQTIRWLGRSRRAQPRRAPHGLIRIDVVRVGHVFS